MDWSQHPHTIQVEFYVTYASTLVESTPPSTPMGVRQLRV